MPNFNAQTQKLIRAQAIGEPLVTRRLGVLGQLLFCLGCCCGQTDKGFPELPRDYIKSQWKRYNLNDTIQLTISGCLGPCDLANVFCLMVPNQTPRWFGGLHSVQQYEALIQWVKDCQRTKQLPELPAVIEGNSFQRFQAPSPCSPVSEKLENTLAIGVVLDSDTTVDGSWQP